MSINQKAHELYLEALRAESSRVIAQVKKDTAESLAKYSYNHATDAYEVVMNRLAEIPGKIKEEIEDTKETYWPKGFGSIDLLNKKLWFIRKSIERSISIATIQVSVIELAKNNGANVSEILKSIKDSSDIIGVECNKLFE
jgi:hypothetical protein